MPLRGRMARLPGEHRHECHRTGWARERQGLWLAGHSQGGLTSTRIVCSDFFKSKVDGFLSLSGGRVGGQAGRAASFAVPPARGAAPACDFSHIFETGEHEINALPATSERAQKYGCSAERKKREVVDIKAGYVYDGTVRIRDQRRGGFCQGQGTQRSCRIEAAGTGVSSRTSFASTRDTLRASSPRSPRNS